MILSEFCLKFDFLSPHSKRQRRSPTSTGKADHAMGVWRGVSKWVEDAQKGATPETGVRGMAGRRTLGSPWPLGALKYTSFTFFWTHVKLPWWF
jgi:hypothetical protein